MSATVKVLETGERTKHVAIASHDVTITLLLDRWTARSARQICRKTIRIMRGDEIKGLWKVVVTHSGKRGILEVRFSRSEKREPCSTLHKATMTVAIQNAEGGLFQRSLRKTVDVWELLNSEMVLEVPFHLARDWDSCSQFQDVNGALEEKITLQFDLNMEYLINPELDPSPEDTANLLEEFSKNTSVKLKDALMGVVALPAFQNGKVVSSDGHEFSVNKELLFARCPAFETEASNGVIRVEENGEVMAILVKYWQTGILDEKWRDPRIISSLAIAADKYEDHDLREVFDETLGAEEFSQASLDLVKVAVKSGYKVAEKNLTKRIGLKLMTARSWNAVVAAVGGADQLRIEPVTYPLTKVSVWMNEKLGGRRASQASVQLLKAAADLKFLGAEQGIAESIGVKARSAEDAHELFAALGIRGDDSVEEPGRKRARLDTANDSGQTLGTR